MFKAFENISVDIFGASHAVEIGVRLSGIPAGHNIDMTKIQALVDRRKSGNNAWSTPRKEDDVVLIEAGIEDGKTTGDTIVATIKNNLQKSKDYASIRNIPRPSHADLAARLKYGDAVDLVGGGRYSGRMTAPMCAAGAIAKQLLAERSISVAAYVSSIGGIDCGSYANGTPSLADAIAAGQRELPILNPDRTAEVTAAVLAARACGDSVGGSVECIIYDCPVGIGDALYEGLEGRLAVSLYAIPAVKAVEFGLGVGFASARGSCVNDSIGSKNGSLVTLTNNNGGLNGGISNGMPITIRVTFKPTPSIAKTQQSVDLDTMTTVNFSIGGRHDACIVPRAVAAVEAAVALTVLDCTLDEDN